MADSRVALVTGGTGFVGSHLIRRLLSENWAIHAVVRPGSDLKLIDPFLDRIQLHGHDGSTEKMLEIVAAAKPSIVFHFASLFLAQHAPKDVWPLVQSNILFSTQLLEAMVENGVQRLINTGTSWQHYENREYSPVCLYAATKEAFEAVLQYYVEASSLKVITLKLYDTYGPGDPRPKLFRMLERAAASKEPLAMSSGEQLIDLVHVDDVIEAYGIAVERLLSGHVSGHEIYAVSSGNPVSLRELVRLYEKVKGIKLPIQWGARPYRPREVMVPWNKGKMFPGWKPKISLKDGIKRLRRDRFL